MNEQNFQGSDDGMNRVGDTYVYEFASGENNTPKREKKPSRAPLVILIGVLCVLLSFAAGFSGAFFARNCFGQQTTETEQKGTIGTTGEVLNANPDEILKKSESSPSEYGSAGDSVFSVSGVVRQVADTVVVIEAEISTTSYFGTSISKSSGSGVVISSDGYILTCNHVVADAVSVSVKLNSGEVYSAALVGSDTASDLAVLRISPEEPLTYAEQGCSADLVVGENVVAIGNPLGTLGGTVTDGIISATERNIGMSDGTTMTLLQTNAAINSGNSGGGLFNLRGQLIGIVNAKYSASGVEGLAFAIPIDSAYLVERDLIRYGYVRGVIDSGLETADITNANLTSAYYRYGITEIGVYVVSSAYCDDLKNKDRIISVNGIAVMTGEELKAALNAYEVGDTVTILASRNGEEFTVTLTLREYVPDRLSDILR